ncbi:MAG: cysteine--tRNA ligase [Candidatus Paceibacterota bacterium]|jgi:cysteinyl-tRNA synthetase
MRILDTLTGKKVGIKKTAKPLKLFVCGPTVYDYPHIGNARVFVFFDIFVRYLKSLGWKIFYLQNITDINDKIIDRAKRDGMRWSEVSIKFEKIYHKNEESLGINSVTKYARATDYIPQIIKQLKALINKEYAYKIERDGYYFDVSKFKDYGKLSKRNYLSAEDATSRIDESIKKRNKGDFCLWKFSKAGEPSWDSDFGNGMPGWHIEDTAITEYHFGPQYDIHGGAVDLKFPHHEAEIAQQEAASGKKPLVKIWMHPGFLLVDGKKMSKSLGNFITIDDFLKTHSADVFRYIVLSHYYRSPIDYSDKLANQSKNSLHNLQNFILKLGMLKTNGNVSKKIKNAILLSSKKYAKAIDDDFNTPLALSEIFTLIKNTEKIIWKMNAKESQLVRDFILKNLGILGINIEKSIRIPQKIKDLTKARELLRGNEQFVQSDVLRQKINELGYNVEDTPLGQLVTRKS